MQNKRLGVFLPEKITIYNTFQCIVFLHTFQLKIKAYNAQTRTRFCLTQISSVGSKRFPLFYFYTLAGGRVLVWPENAVPDINGIC